LQVARCIDLGSLPPLRLHAAYRGLAEAQREGASPIVLWARSAAGHVSLGQTQSAAHELDLEACRREGVEVIRRPLGGGAVLVDEHQQALFVIAPYPAAASPPREFGRRCLEPMAVTCQAFGVPASRVGDTDIFCNGAKLAGSGMATIGACLVFGSSFIERFAHERFCRLVRAPSDDFRVWLREALTQGLLAWPDPPGWPGEATLREVFLEKFEGCLGWRYLADVPRPAEIEAIGRAEEALRAETAEDDGGGRRRVPHGIKINARTFLTETQDRRGWLRVLVKEGRIARIAVQDRAAAERLPGCLGRPARGQGLREALGAVFPAAEAAYWAARVEATACTEG
jgi:lipoate-protein ligase A